MKWSTRTTPHLGNNKTTTHLLQLTIYEIHQKKVISGQVWVIDNRKWDQKIKGISWWLHVYKIKTDLLSEDKNQMKMSWAQSHKLITKALLNLHAGLWRLIKINPKSLINRSEKLQTFQPSLSKSQFDFTGVTTRTFY